MIEKLIKAKTKTFRYGEVSSYSAASQTATVQVGDKTVSVSAPTALVKKGMVILAQNDQDKSWVIVEANNNRTLPSQKTLLAL